jgi:outer membrane protein
VDLDGYTERNDMGSLSFASASSSVHERQSSSLIARATGRHLISLTREILLATILVAPVGLSAQESDTRSVEVLGLDRAVARALDSNRQLKIAALDVERAQQRVAEARTKRLPTFSTYVLESQLITSLDFTVRAGQFGIFNTIGPVPSTDTKISTPRQPTTYVTAQVAQPLSQLHQIGLSIRAQEVGTDIAREALRQARQAVVDQVKQAYYTMLQTQSSLESAEDTLKYCEELDQVTDRYYVQKVVLKSDTLTVKAQVARARYQILTLRDALTSQRESLNQLMGRDLKAEFNVQPVAGLTAYETDLDVGARALDERPEVRQARLKAKQASLDYRVQVSKYIPDISLSVNYLSTFNVEFLPRNVASAGVVVSWEPFDWGRKRRELAEKALAIQQADFSVREAEQSVLVDVNARLRKLQQARAFVEVARLAQETEKEKLRVVTNEYPLKAALLKDLLQQQAAVADANNQHQQALLAFWIAKADFERALGGE